VAAVTEDKAPVADLGDELPDDLVPAAARGPYAVPDNARRRRPAVVLAVAGACCVALYLVRGDAVLVNSGTLALGLSLLAAAAYFLLSASPVKVWEDGAIARAKRDAGFEVGHARAQLAWRGLIGRPIWRVLLYEAGEKARRRAVYVIDARNGGIVEHLTETMPAEADRTDVDPSDVGGEKESVGTD
jgi:hypothetical protein